MEMRERSIPFEAQKTLTISYKGRELRKGYVADLVCYEGIMVELKAVERLSSGAESQIINYLKAGGLRVCILINFGSFGKLEWKRFAN
jgi:GxxExxY protein